MTSITLEKFTVSDVSDMTSRIEKKNFTVGDVKVLTSRNWKKNFSPQKSVHFSTKATDSMKQLIEDAMHGEDLNKALIDIAEFK